jgi:AcrR family transcriptional regulator
VLAVGRVEVEVALRGLVVRLTCLSIRVSVINVKVQRRPYRMNARAAGVAATRERILDAMVALAAERGFRDVPLEEIADRADTTAQTVLRHFGTKDGVMSAAIRRETGRVVAEREQVPVGDAAAVAAYLAGHYEEAGDSVLYLLSEERRLPVAAEIVGQGRELHRSWVARTFAPWLEGLERGARRRRHALLVAATDVYTWKLLRRDARLGRDQYELAVRELLQSIEGGPS